jgi:hypothetical protein
MHHGRRDGPPGNRETRRSCRQGLALQGDHHTDLDAAIADIDRIRKFLGRTKDRQIRNGPDRDFLKATALSWFRSRRPIIATVLGADLLEAIDKPYQIILDASEKQSSRTNYVTAATVAKEALLAARRALLAATPQIGGQSLADQSPDFSPLASDPVMRTILARRWQECRLCMSAGAALAATVMMGGLLEALFVARANRMMDKAQLFASPATPVDHKTKKALELRQWTLAPYIDVGHDLQWISRSAKDVAVILRDYRNYIHPEKERSHGVALTVDDARMFWEITKTLSRELLSLKGVN